MTDFLTWWAKSHPLRPSYGPNAREYEAGFRIGAFTMQFYWLRAKRRREP